MATSWFDKFLKLLGIEEDKPVSSDNAFSVTGQSAPAATAKTHAAEPATEPVKSEPKKAEPEPEPVVSVAEKPVAETIAKEEAPEDTVPEPEPEPEPEPAKTAADSLQAAYPGLKANFVKVLTEAGFDSKAAIDKASDKELLALKGIGQATLKILRGK